MSSVFSSPYSLVRMVYVMFPLYPLLSYNKIHHIIFFSGHSVDNACRQGVPQSLDEYTMQGVGVWRVGVWGVGVWVVGVWEVGVWGVDVWGVGV